jgi:hypothetical protein
VLTVWLVTVHASQTAMKIEKTSQIHVSDAVTFQLLKHSILRRDNLVFAALHIADRNAGWENKICIFV